MSNPPKRARISRLVDSPIHLDAHYGAARLDLALIVLRFFFGDAQSDQRAAQTDRGGARGGAGKDGSQHSPGDRRPNGREQSRGNPQAPQGADAGAGRETGCRAFLHARTLVALGNVAMVDVLACHPDLLFAKASPLQLDDCFLRHAPVFEHSDHRLTVQVRHNFPPFRVCARFA